MRNPPKLRVAETQVVRVGSLTLRTDPVATDVIAALMAENASLRAQAGALSGRLAVLLDWVRRRAETADDEAERLASAVMLDCMAPTRH
jgi:hypothetical protein